MRSPVWLLLGLGSLSFTVGACARVAPLAESLTGSGGTGVRPNIDGGTRTDRGGPSNIPTMCGDGIRTSDEACDDGNTSPDDGCSADCKTVAPGYSCNPPGKPCHRVARCGDGVLVPPELCDDGNTNAGDGCSATCKVELGFKCTKDSPSVCTPTKCGDHIVEGAESCDDGNNVPYDGCSADCTTEPNCTAASGACVSSCGDGVLVPPEVCDDGNKVDGDGCSSTCQTEPGFMCAQPPLGASMQVPVVYRDFRYHTPADFEPSGAMGLTKALPGLVQTTLDAAGKPVFTGLAGAYITSQQTFLQWYRDMPGTNHTTTGKITLWNNGNGAYVNRYGANGEQWPLTTKEYFCGGMTQAKLDATGAPIPCTFQFGTTACDTDLAMGYKLLQCITDPVSGQYSAIFQTALLDGNPFFFPVDGDMFTPLSERSTATVGPPYSAQFIPEPGTPAPMHNFSFTSEVRYWFQYDATTTYKLDFFGDDDVWLFINRKLAVDLGGIHSSDGGSVTIAPGAGTTMFGLADKQVYEVAVFQAERKTNGSTYELTLSGFSAAPSDCVPKCGDGIVGLGEECDDGVNAGGYGQCGPTCKYDQFCGDGIVQPQFEDCDDGVNIGNPCPSGCKNLFIP
jgi:fibro-slime domain-containing protein